MTKRKTVESGLVCTAAVLAIGQSATHAATFTSGMVSASIDTTDNSAAVTTLPYFTAEAATDDNGVSTTTPDFSGLVFKTSFSQSLLTTITATGESTVNFIGGAGDTYSLFGSTAPVGGSSTFTISLLDNTSGTYLYNADGVLPTIGSTVGNLTAGDSYTFDLYDELDAGAISFIEPLAATAIATNTGSGGITIVPGVVPEPGVVGVGVLTVAAMQRFFRRREPTRLV